MQTDFRRRGRRVKLAASCALALAASLVLAAPSFADSRFAAPTPIGTMDCSTPENACDIQTAVEMASAGDDVTLAQGDYMLAVDDGVAVPADVTVHGAAGQARPRIITNTGVSLGAGSTLRRVEIEHGGVTSSGRALLGSGGSTVEQAVVHTTDGQNACEFVGNAVVRDSLCWNSKTGAVVARGLVASGPPPGIVVTARNVTAVATSADSGVGLQVRATAPSSFTVNATNVIADGALADVRAEVATPTATATVNLDHSNYATEDETGMHGTGSVTDPGSGTNQIAPPLFVNPAMGDFHQPAGSPTRNAGIGGAGLGSADFDGEARLQGTAPDIGADEFPEAPATGTAPPAAPSAVPISTPRKKKCKKGRKLKKGKCVKKQKKKKKKKKKKKR